jgi:hypothetical protein
MGIKVHALLWSCPDIIFRPGCQKDRPPASDEGLKFIKEFGLREDVNYFELLGVNTRMTHQAGYFFIYSKAYGWDINTYVSEQEGFDIIRQLEAHKHIPVRYW